MSTELVHVPVPGADVPMRAAMVDGQPSARDALFMAAKMAKIEDKARIIAALGGRW